MGRNAQKRRLITDPRAAAEWAASHRKAIVEAAMVKYGCDLPTANRLVERLLAPPAARSREARLGDRLSAMLLGLVAVASAGILTVRTLVKVRRD